MTSAEPRVSRDYAAELRAIVDAETSRGPYVSRVVAADVVGKLLANDPDLLDGWLHANAENFVWQMINDRDRSLRSHARQTSGRREFAADAKDHAEGNSAPLVRWLTVPFAVADGSRKRLAEMTADDLLFAADGYEARARENKMTAAFLKAIARKVKKGKVSDHFADEQLVAMWESLGGNS